jgi:hypothetical protein
LTPSPNPRGIHRPTARRRTAAYQMLSLLRELLEISPQNRVDDLGDVAPDDVGLFANRAE